ETGADLSWPLPGIIAESVIEKRADLACVMGSLWSLREPDCFDLRFVWRQCDTGIEEIEA
ncbi:MAG TPA: hypothetical protein VJ476_05860, partial [Rhizomicrobium sp.]|nr:hypothetical protein [Rhizomicrobium sp.]